MSGQFSFGKSEKLVSRKMIDTLFNAGETVKAYPIIAKFIIEESYPTPKVAFSVPKRRVKSAVKRNRIKRQMREAYRLNKSLIAHTNNQGLALFLIYNGPEKASYQFIEDKIVLLLQGIAKKL